jgi:hypothetical protein
MAAALQFMACRTHRFGTTLHPDRAAGHMTSALDDQRRRSEAWNDACPRYRIEAEAAAPSRRQRTVAMDDEV